MDLVTRAIEMQHRIGLIDPAPGVSIESSGSQRLCVWTEGVCTSHSLKMNNENVAVFCMGAAAAM